MSNIDNINKLVEKEYDDFPDWYVSISFGKSRSKNYKQAVTLAKMAPKYIENTVDGNILHQAIYSEKCEEYLSFIKLYELINNWKSSFVAINGKLVDRKIIGGINYCYGDKCRSGNPDFCYGASQFTKNPFGCHRLQISQYNNPWWTFGEYDTKDIWHLKKDEILKRIKENAKPYQLCPAFSFDEIMNAFNKIPDTINPNKSDKWIKQGETISHIEKERSRNVGSYNINININDNTNKDQPASAKEYLSEPKDDYSGCIGCLVVLAIIFFIFLLALL